MTGGSWAFTAKCVISGEINSLMARAWPAFANGQSIREWPNFQSIGEYSLMDQNSAAFHPPALQMPSSLL